MRVGHCVSLPQASTDGGGAASIGDSRQEAPRIAHRARTPPARRVLHSASERSHSAGFRQDAYWISDWGTIWYDGPDPIEETEREERAEKGSAARARSRARSSLPILSFARQAALLKQILDQLGAEVAATIRRFGLL